LRLLVTPVLCAACGLAAEIVVAPRLLAELVALTAAIAIIAVTRAPVGPALAAAVLPAVAASGVTHPPVVAVSVVPLVLGPPGSWTDLLTGASSVAFAAAILYTSGSAALNVAVDRRFHLLRTPRGGTSQGATGLRHLITSRDTRSQP
jgi:hypothetical protein